MGERRKKVNDDGERSLIKASSNASINSQAADVPANATAATSTRDLEREARKQFQQDVTPAFVYVLAAFSALGGFLFGYDTGVISGAMLLLKREMNLSALWQEVLISSTVAAAALSALAGGFLNGVFGRRVCILLASFIFTAGGIVLSAAPDKEVLLVGRLIVGLGLGKVSATLNLFTYLIHKTPWAISLGRDYEITCKVHFFLKNADTKKQILVRIRYMDTENKWTQLTNFLLLK